MNIEVIRTKVQAKEEVGDGVVVEAAADVAEGVVVVLKTFKKKEIKIRIFKKRHPKLSRKDL
jgi:hypothetical protein